jgi:hypothetical protein
MMDNLVLQQRKLTRSNVLVFAAMTNDFKRPKETEIGYKRY